MPRIHAAPTLDDVAKMAGVSSATVSRCFNSPEQVVEKTRDKVMQAVEQLGYTPNFGARVMAAKRTFTIGAIIPTMENAIFARGLQAFQEALNTRGYNLLVSSNGYQADVEAEQVKALVARGADGLLLIGFERAQAVYDYLQGQSVPALVAWAYGEGSTPPSIGFDNRGSMRQLADQVIAMGHRRIAVISGVTNGNDRAALRVQGIKDSLQAHGLGSAALKIIETPYGVESGGCAFEQLMRGPDKPTAIMCGNDILAAGAIRRAQDLRIAVPDEVSITGFDDIELARIVSPALTTVHVPHREMGRRAADELISMVEGSSAGKSSRLESTLQLRESLRQLP